MEKGIKKVILAIGTIFAVIWILFFMSFYGIRLLAINEYNIYQMVLAEQAAAGINDYMENLAGELEYLSAIEDVYSFNAKGVRIIRDYYNRRMQIIKSVTRVDENGRIKWSVPFNRKIVGADISTQPHVAYLLREHKPSLSDVFISVQGYRTIALHIPVVRGGGFRGSIAVLIDFEYFTSRFLDKISIGEGGYAWMLSANGIMLYSPVPGYPGKSVYETFSGFPQLVEICEKMMKGEKGSGSYEHNLVRDKFKGMMKKYAAYTPVNIMNTRWSIAVSTPEKQILAIMDGLRNKLILTAFLLILVNIAFIFISLKSWKLADDIIKKSQNEVFLAENETVLEAALNSAGSVAGGIAHDLNNVLAGILNSAEVLEMKHKGDEKSEKYTGFIKGAASRGTALVQKLSNLSLMGKGVNSFMDVHQVVDEVRHFIMDKSGNRIKIKLQLNAGDSMVQASPLNLRKIIIRLTGKIAEAVPESRGLILATENVFMGNISSELTGGSAGETEYLRLSARNIPVKDAGKHIENSFRFLISGAEPGEKADPGIYEVYRSVNEIGGSMSIDLSEKDSPVVSVILPICKVDGSRLTRSEIELTKSGGTILIVEDEPAIRNALERILTDLGYSVYIAENGLDGVELFRREHKMIDLVILDIVMPVMGGIEALKEMIEIDSGAVIFMTSGYITVANLDELIAKGAAGFINKPVTIPDLSRIVSGAIAEKGKKKNKDVQEPEISKA